MKSYAVVDIGTLKVKTEIASVSPDGTLNRIYNSNTLTCFGLELEENNGNVKEKYLARTIDELKRIKEIFKEYAVSNAKVVSTHAMRKAKNRVDIIDSIRKETGFEVENISQEQEAEYFFSAVLATFPDSPQEYGIVDVGGGSVQVLVGSRGHLRTSALMPTGTVTLQESVLIDPHAKTGITTAKDIEKMKQIILDNLIRFEATPNIPLVYGSSMIIDVMKKIGLHLEPHENSKNHPYKTYANHLQKFISEILPLTYEEREAKYDLPHGFMYGIDKGFLNILTIGEHLHSPYIIPSNANIAQGIIYSLAR